MQRYVVHCEREKPGRERSGGEEDGVARIQHEDSEGV